MMNDQELVEEYIRLALAINEYSPWYIDSYAGPETWMEEAKQVGKVALQELSDRAKQLETDVIQAGWDEQRKDFLLHQIQAMQMSLRLLAGEKVPLVEQVQALYDFHPVWKDEVVFLEAQKQLDELLPGKGPLNERLEQWNTSLEISEEKIKDLLPGIITRLRELTNNMFDIPHGETFHVEFVSAKPWRAYNWYLGNYQSRIEFNQDLPIRVNELPDLLAHEGYPGHHTELCMKEAKLIKQQNYQEHMLTLLNSPASAIAEGIAMTALETLLTDEELEDWYRSEVLPRAGMTHIDALRMMEVSRAERKLSLLEGNAVFMMYDQNKTREEIHAYARHYGLKTTKEADRLVEIIPIAGSYMFTYIEGRALLEELFTNGDRIHYFTRLLTEPVTPSQIRQWVKDRHMV